ncbi:MAG: aldo/keto reductase [Treponema sp.]|nr:aldo/keto reductase [Treponema sp.]
MNFKSAVDTYKLSDGTEIPCIGFGTWQTPDGETAVNAVKAALEAGYRHIDAAAVYNNETSVGKAIRESGIPRKDIFVTSKLANSRRGYDSTVEGLNKTLSDMGLDYLDLYLIHWPNPKNFRDNWQHNNSESWRAMEDLVKAGKIKALGVSNFHEHHLDALIKNATIKPTVNQIRLCPGDTKDAIVKASRDRDILLEAYSPFGGTVGGMGSNSILKAPLLLELEKKYSKSSAQISLRWSLQMGFLPLPKSVTPANIVSNLSVFDFELAEEDVKALSKLEGYPDPFAHPDEAPF